jgi:hypothetical protein
MVVRLRLRPALRAEDGGVVRGGVLEEGSEEWQMSEHIWRKVTYVLRDVPHFGLRPGFCIMGLETCSGMDWTEVEQLHTRKKHVLKTWPEFYDAIQRGGKNFELRRDDREPRYAVGDVLQFELFVPSKVEGEK